MKKYAATFGMCIFLSTSLAVSSEKTNSTVVNQFAIYYLSVNLTKEAQAILNEQLALNPGDYDNWNLLGLVDMRRREYASAIAAFLQAIKTSNLEDALIYRYNLADAQARSGDIAASKRTLEPLLAFAAIRDSARDALDELKSGSPLPPIHIKSPGKWSKSVAVRGGYDTNALQTPDASLALDKANGVKSAFIEPSASLEYSRELAHATYAGSFNSKFTDYLSTKATTYNSLLSTGDTHWTRKLQKFSKLRAEYGASGMLDFLNNNGFRFYFWSVTPYLKQIWEQSLFNQTTFALYPAYEKFATSIGDNPANDRSGYSGKFEVLQRHNFGATAVFAGAGFQKGFSSGDNYKSQSYYLPIGLSTTQLFWDLFMAVNFQAGRTFYSKSINLRKDTNLVGGINLLKRVASSFTAGIDFSYTKDISSSESNRYSKQVAGVSITYDF